jgi:thiol-disulfide isomerase/thioredoxin
MDHNSDVNTERWVDGQLAKLGPDRAWRPDVMPGLARFNQQRTGSKQGGRTWRWATAAALVSGAGLLALPAPRAMTQRLWGPCLAACESFFVKAGDAVGSAGRTSVAQMAPDFTLQDARGARFSLSDYRGRVVLLNFWATWCTPCQAEIPWFSEFERSYGQRGFAVIGIAMDDDGWKPVMPFLIAKGINYRVAVGNETLTQKYGGLEALPETLLIDREGRIAVRHVGVLGRNQSETEIVRLLRK